MESGPTPAINRRGFLGWTAFLASAMGWASPREASGHALPPESFGSPAYERALAAEGGYRAVFQSSQIEASVKAGDTLEHLLLGQLNNWLNGFEFSYKSRPGDLHAVVATYASANLLSYGDTVWQKYRLGEKYNVIDPATNAPAVRNLFWASRYGPGATADPDDPKSRYRDNGIEALQRRGVLVLT